MRRRHFLALAGGAVAWPLSAFGQQQRTGMPRIAIVHPSDPIASLTATGGFRWQAFFAQLERLGFSEGKNLVVERYSGGGLSERYAELAKEVVNRKPDAIVTNSNRMASHFQRATDTIPVVAFTADPVLAGITSNLGRPDRNVTGAVTDAGYEVNDKKIALLKEIVPHLQRIGFLGPRAALDGPMGPFQQRAAERTGVALIKGALENPIYELEYARVFAILAKERVDGLIVLPAPENVTHLQSIVELAAKGKLPTIYHTSEFTDAGGLMAYAIDLIDLYSRVADQLVAILRGAKVSEVPFYQATTFKLVINLKTAKALGITVPATLLARADEVIE
ncbi:MAG: ABC transporter substrate-binding protein [Hyphomicrobiaceae bacterium]